MTETPYFFEGTCPLAELEAVFDPDTNDGTRGLADGSVPARPPGPRRVGQRGVLPRLGQIPGPGPRGAALARGTHPRGAAGVPLDPPRRAAGHAARRAAPVVRGIEGPRRIEPCRTA